MKRFKIGFLALIAVLAMSFTVASHEGAFKTKKVLAETDCFLPTINQIRAADCNSTLNPLTTTTTCNAAQAYVGGHIFQLTASNAIPSEEVEETCPDPQDFFCCAFLEEDDQPCSGQQAFDIGAGAKLYRIASVRCKVE